MKKHLLVSINLLLAAGVFAQSVTVGPVGSGATHTSLNAAITAVGSNPVGPDTITIIDNGPFLENRIIVNQGSGTEDLTIKAAPGLRPIIVVDMNGSTSKASAVYLRKKGNMVLRDIIVIPTAQGVVDETTYLAKVAEAGLEVDDWTTDNTSVTLENILISSNNGSNQPIASLDGLTSPTWTASTISFKDEGVLLNSATVTTTTRHIYMNDFIVSGVSGVDDSDGIRGFMDGAPGSEWVIGPGCVVSYCNTVTEPPITSSTVRGAFQPGGTEGVVVKVQGTKQKPVRFINNNLSGIFVTGTNGAGYGLKSVEWLISANNTGAGFVSVDPDEDVNFANVTFANHADGLFLAPTTADEANYTFLNTIFAGNGNATQLSNIINLVTGTGAGIFTSSFTMNNSATVLTGPYTMNNVHFGGDGINSDSKWIVTSNGTITADPQFLSLDPTQGGFAVVSNQAYGTAGTGGQPLTGGGGFAPSSVADWQLF